MKQEVMAGAVLCAMGLDLLFVSPNAWWKAAEKWKTKDGSGPAKCYTVFLRALGVVFFGAGIKQSVDDEGEGFGRGDDGE